MNLVIVESPTKAKTISRFLTKDYKVESSFGHIRDLPKSKMGIDIEHDFTPQYVIPTKAKKVVTTLKKLATKADNIYFATDQDREGEAISWHLAQIFKTPEAKIKRITFHEITEEAILHALKNPQALDLHMVDAQQARRVLDRLVGYELSPFLWKKVTKGLSAGRVQSVTVRLIVEREREIKDFKIEEYWTIAGQFAPQNNLQQIFKANLRQVEAKVLEKFSITTEAQAQELVNQIGQQPFTVADLTSKSTLKLPNAPFTTSTLQQEANRRLGFSAKQTMMIAQQLYEGVDLGPQGSVGLITYMRTDSVNLAEKFLTEAHQYIIDNFGANYTTPKPRHFSKTQKSAQEAHEAIRPTDVKLAPQQIETFLNDNQFKLYQLIWQRAVACQMAGAKLENAAADLISQDQKFIFRANGQVVKFDGWLKVYPVATKEELLPALQVKETIVSQEIKSEQHFTQPPARYTDASLVKALEEYGIGRPSTYAPTISTIIDRGYVEREEKRLKPTEIAFIVIDLLIKHFPQIVDYQFTAKLEDDLDAIAEGKTEWVPVISNFYHPFKELLNEKMEEVKKSDIMPEEKTDEVCEKCNSPMIIKRGRYGKFLACSNFPDCKNTKKIDKNGQEIPEPLILDKKCPDCGAPLQQRVGRYGPFVGCSKYPDCKYIEKNNGTGVACPQCGVGEIVSKRGRGRVFYACNKYPDCKFALWSKPTGEKCPNCQSLIVYGKNGSLVCSKKDCGYTKEAV
ncbi:MAG: type I DNA topoisomerase [Candidatus Buchananbacteria bacterium]